MIEDLQGVQNEKSNSKLLDSDLSSLHISKQTGVPQSTIHRMRKNERSLDNMSLKNAELLYKFANGIFSDEN